MQATANSHHSNGLADHNVGSSTVEGWMGHDCASGTGATAWSQTGASQRGRGSGEEKDEEEGRTHPEELSSHISGLDSILKHIAQQLDVLTQVSCSLKVRMVK